MKFSLKYVFFFVLSLLLSSCVMNKKIVYFQNETKLDVSAINSYNPIFRADDLISIFVYAGDKESVMPFNINSTNLITNNAGYTTGAPAPQSYLIDKEGNIDFPVIGKIKIGGLLRSEAIELLRTKIKEFVAEPTIHIKIVNFKITVLGEVVKPGVYTIPNERLTLLEAIGLAGDLTITGVRNNILVLREVDGKKVEYRVDITNSDFVNSPVYYLNQNDVVYIEPNRSRINSSSINPSLASIVISSVSLLVTTIVLITK